MNAVEFIKKFGWDRAKREVSLIGTIAMMCGDSDFNNDLKRLVESHELVESYGGLACCKNHIGFLSDSMRQAILDVESCQ